MARLSGFGLRPDDLDHQQARADDDGGVGEVEVRPVVGSDVEADEVDDVVVDDAIVQVSDGSAEDECQSDAGKAEAPAGAHQHNADHHNGGDRKENQTAADQIGRGGVSEEAEGCTGIEDVGDVQDAGNNGMRAAHLKTMADEFLADVVSNGDEGREREKEREVEAPPIGRLTGLWIELGRRVLVALGHFRGLLRVVPRG